MTYVANAQETEQGRLSFEEKGFTRSKPGFSFYIWSFVLVAIVLVTLLADVLAPFDPDTQDLRLGAVAPFSHPDHILGTDQLGRDMLSRLIHGGRLALGVAFVATVLASVLGVILGVTAGYVSGKTDGILSRITEMQLAIPTVLLAMMIIGMGARGTAVLIAILAVAEWPLFFRLSRSQTASVRPLVFVSAARSYDASHVYILRRHVIRGALPTITVAFTITMASAIALQSSLSYLGLGVQPPQADWGAMVAQGQSQMAASWWISVLPGVAIALFVYAANRFGDYLSNYFAAGDFSQEQNS